MRRVDLGRHSSRRRAIPVRAITMWGFGVLALAVTAVRAQVSATWTGVGLTPAFNDPYNWSSFPQVPGNGGQVTFNGPYRSQLNLSLTQEVVLSRWANVGSLGIRAVGSGS